MIKKIIRVGSCHFHLAVPSPGNPYRFNAGLFAFLYVSGRVADVVYVLRLHALLLNDIQNFFRFAEHEIRTQDIIKNSVEVIKAQGFPDGWRVVRRNHHQGVISL